MGKRGFLIVMLIAAAVAVVPAVLLWRAAFGPRPDVVVLDQPATPGEIAGSARGLADFTVIDPPLPAPQTPFADGDGRTVTLADFKGRVVLLNLWATWCAPCVKEMPSLDRLQAALGGEDFAVVALSFDRKGAEVVRPFYATAGLTHLAVHLDPKNAMLKALEVRGLPISLLIDRTGAIVGRLEGPAEWDSPEALALIRAAVAAPVPAGS